MLAPLLIRRVDTSLLSFLTARWGVSVHQGLGFGIRYRKVEVRIGVRVEEVVCFFRLGRGEIGRAHV